VIVRGYFIAGAPYFPVHVRAASFQASVWLLAGDFVSQQDLWVVQRDLSQLPAAEAARILRLPSVMGRELINQFQFLCDYPAGVVELRRA
jgi:hypothetical protein